METKENDPQVFTKEYMEQLYDDVLCKQDTIAFDKYFTKDCSIHINGKSFTNEKFKQRMKWIKENSKSVSVTVENFFVSKDNKQITDSHITTAVTNDGKERKIFVIQQSTIENNKIKTFIDASYVMQGDKDTNVITAHK